MNSTSAVFATFSVFSVFSVFSIACLFAIVTLAMTVRKLGDKSENSSTSTMQKGGGAKLLSKQKSDTPE